MSLPLPPLPTLRKTRRNIRALLIVGLLIALVAVSLGGLIFYLGYPRPDITQPFWEFGRYVLLIGLANLTIYAALFWQVRQLSRRPRSPSA